jgi:hypothetical protein
MGIFRRLTSQGEGSTLYPFKFEITTTTANRAFRLPIFDYEGLTPSFVVDWGDSSSDVITSSSDAALTHNYVSIGSYTISISGFMPAFTVNNSVSNRSLYTAIVQFGINGLRRLPIVIGGFEAQAIAVALERMNPSRPLTHDLMKNFMIAANVDLHEIIINDLQEGIFFSL